MTQFLQTLFNGAVASSVYLLIALGITIVFGLTRLINFAHGQFLVVAAFVTYELTSRGQPYVVGVAGGVLVVFVLSLLAEQAVFRRTLANPLSGLIAGLGLLLVLEAALVKIWGPDPVQARIPIRGAVEIGELTFARMRIVILGVTALTALITLLLLQRSKRGRQIRAANDNALAASHVGVNVPRMITVAFVGGSVVAALAGALLATLFPLSAYDGGGFIIKGFAVALLGGLGNVAGAVAASVFYGMGETMVAVYLNPQWVSAFTFGAIILVLAIRPSGLFAKGSASEAHEGSTWIGRAAPTRAPTLLTKLAGPVLAIAIAIVSFQLLPTARLEALFVVAVIYAIQVYALSLLFHHAGMVSLAHGGLMAIGAYTGAILGIERGWDFWLVLPIAFVFSAIVGMLVAYPATRSQGHYFLLITFALGELIVVVAENWKSVTKGDSGLLLLDRPNAIGPFTFDSLESTYYLYLVILLGVVAAIALVARSGLGDRFHTIRDNEALAASLGLNVRLYKVIAFGISGGIAGLGGVMFLYHQQAISPLSFEVLVSLQFVIMLVLGGRSLLGPAVGVAVIVLMPEAIGLSPIDKQLVNGIVLLIVVLLVPDGIVPSVERLGRWIRAAVFSGRGAPTSDRGLTDVDAPAAVEGVAPADVVVR